MDIRTGASASFPFTLFRLGPVSPVRIQHQRQRPRLLLQTGPRCVPVSIGRRCPSYENRRRPRATSPTVPCKGNRRAPSRAQGLGSSVQQFSRGCPDPASRTAWRGRPTPAWPLLDHGTRCGPAVSHRESRQRPIHGVRMNSVSSRVPSEQGTIPSRASATTPARFRTLGKPVPRGQEIDPSGLRTAPKPVSIHRGPQTEGRTSGGLSGPVSARTRDVFTLRHGTLPASRPDQRWTRQFRFGQNTCRAG